jgi:hypothetical protein
MYKISSRGQLNMGGSPSCEFGERLLFSDRKEKQGVRKFCRGARNLRHHLWQIVGTVVNILNPIQGRPITVVTRPKA